MVAPLLMDIYLGIVFSTPAFFGNAVPVFVSGLGRLDGGRNFVDGKPFFGSHKTKGGVLAGILGGGIVGFVVPLFHPEIYAMIPGYSIWVGFVMGFGSILGDALGSFIKRRIKIKPGASFPIVDQVGFVFTALVLASFMVDFPLGWWWVVPVTLLIHLISNIWAYLFGWKEVWY
ncbi:MAG: CDP-archaeol synthase [Candidatus Kariarchaeaceae archaeon]